MNRASSGVTCARAFAVSGAVLVGLAGCEAPPTATMSDPAVFTQLHIRAVQSAYAQESMQLGGGGRVGGLTPFFDLHRYFASSEKSFNDNRLRMDAMLDASQRSDSFQRRSELALATSLAIRAADLGTTDSAAPAASAATTMPTQTGENDATVFASLFGTTPTDSPFDRLERVRAFYTSYILTVLRLYGTDSRAHYVHSFDPIAVVSATQPANPSEAGGETAEKHAVFATSFARALALEVSLSASSQMSEEVKKVEDGKQQTQATREQLISRFAYPPDKEYAGSTSLDNFWQRRKNVAELHSQRLAATAQVEKTKNEHKAAATALAKKQAELQRHVKSLAEREARVKFLAELPPAQITGVDTLKGAIEERDKAADAVAALQYEIADTLQSATVNAAKALAVANAQVNQLLEAIEYQIWTDAVRIAQSVRVEGDAPQRLVLLLLQPHIEPGSKPNQVLEFKVKIDRTTPANKLNSTKIVFVHPGRTYDTADSARSDIDALALSTAISGAVGGGSTQANASFASDYQRSLLERSRYLSRINKTSSFANRERGRSDSDPTHPVFGWHFYPSNVRVDKSWGDFKATGYLEPGARDCAVWVLVDTDVTALSLTTSTRSRTLDAVHSDWSTDSGQRGCRFEVSVPAYSPAEHGSAALPSAPPAGPGVLTTSPQARGTGMEGGGGGTMRGAVMAPAD